MGIDLKTRIPEPMQEMEGNLEAQNYLASHMKRHKKGRNPYDFIARDIFVNINLDKGKVLDVGCGYGNLIKNMKHHKKNLSFAGIDVSKSMIKLAENYIDFPAKFLFMSADKLSFKDESFDLVVCKDTFHHFGNPIKVIKEMFRVLKKGGFIYMSDLRRDVPEDIFYQTLQNLSIHNVVNATQYFDSVRASYTLSELKNLLNRAGINEYKLKCGKITKNFIRDYCIDIGNYLFAVNYFLGRWFLIMRKR
ncbi:class I SAM-dependent methyltransferase [Candidatus Pacearchaeota archaeon]|nr:class I SAM-dependent methyltransferase [Candidatus Pacearchaeota archaeon]